ncbi:hypothetical protein Bca101_073479 [Brassica carinata]
MFRRRYRMSRPLFLRVIEAVESYDNYFTQNMDACRVGLSSLQKNSGRISDVSIWSSCSVGRFRKIKNKEAHFTLRNSLIDHL